MIRVDSGPLCSGARHNCRSGFAAAALNLVGADRGAVATYDLGYAAQFPGVVLQFPHLRLGKLAVGQGNCSTSAWCPGWYAAPIRATASRSLAGGCRTTARGLIELVKLLGLNVTGSYHGHQGKSDGEQPGALQEGWPSMPCLEIRSHPVSGQAPVPKVTPLVVAIPQADRVNPTGEISTLGQGLPAGRLFLPRHYCRSSTRKCYLIYIKPEPSAPSPQRVSWRLQWPSPVFNNRNHSVLPVRCPGTSGTTPMPTRLGVGSEAPRWRLVLPFTLRHPADPTLRSPRFLVSGRPPPEARKIGLQSGPQPKYTYPRHVLVCILMPYRQLRSCQKSPEDEVHIPSIYRSYL